MVEIFVGKFDCYILETLGQDHLPASLIDIVKVYGLWTPYDFYLVATRLMGIYRKHVMTFTIHHHHIINNIALHYLDCVSILGMIWDCLRIYVYWIFVLEPCLWLCLSIHLTLLHYLTSSLSCLIFLAKRGFWHDDSFQDNSNDKSLHLTD